LLDRGRPPASAITGRHRRRGSRPGWRRKTRSRLRHATGRTAGKRTTGHRCSRIRHHRGGVPAGQFPAGGETRPEFLGRSSEAGTVQAALQTKNPGRRLPGLGFQIGRMVLRSGYFRRPRRPPRLCLLRLAMIASMFSRVRSGRS
jgi:hypothetical protein